MVHPRFGPSSEPSGELSAVTLTFVNKELEQSFLDRRRQRVLSSLRWTSVVFFIVMLANLLAVNMQELQRFCSEEDSQTDVCHVVWLQFVYTVSFGGQLVLCITCLFFAMRFTRESIVQTWVVEASIVISASICILAFPFFTLYYVAHAHGFPHLIDVLDANMGGLLPSIALHIDVIVTVMHLMPIRWKWLLAPQISAVLALLLPGLAFDAPNGSGPLAQHIVALSSLVLLVSTSKRGHEITEREQFLDLAKLIREKRLRFHAEFELSQQRATTTHMVRDGDSTSLAGTPSVASTEKASLDFCIDSIRTVGQRENWLIPAWAVQLQNAPAIGEGGFGLVAKGLYQGMQVAVKAAKKSIEFGVRADSAAITSLCNELRILRRLRHPNIVFFNGAVLSPLQDNLRVYLILELLGGTTIGAFIQGSHDCKTASRVQLLVDIGSALRYLHSQTPSVVHGDLNINNVFVEAPLEACRAKLLDFGLSRRATRRAAKPLGGVLRWMPPEARKGKSPVTPAADVFSFGRVMFFVTTGQKPFADVPHRKLRKFLTQAPEMEWPSTSEGSCSWHFKPLVELCTQVRPELRPGIPDVQHTLGVLASDLQVNLLRDAEGGCVRGGLSRDHREVFGAFDLAPEQDGVDLSAVRNSDVHDSDLRPVPEGAALVGDPTNSNSWSAGTSHVRRVPTRLVYPNHTATPKETMLESAAILIKQWNVGFSLDCCCELHAGMLALAKTCDGLAATECRGVELHLLQGQCRSCDLLRFQGDQGSACGFCGEALQPSELSGEGSELAC